MGPMEGAIDGKRGSDIYTPVLVRRSLGPLGLSGHFLEIIAS